MPKKNTFARRTPTDIGLHVWGILVFAYLFIPIAVIIAYSFNTGKVLANFRGFGLDINSDALDLTSSTIALAYGVGLAVTLVSAYLPARRASRTAPVAAMRSDTAPADPRPNSRRRPFAVVRSTHERPPLAVTWR